jgi:signal transduction histidine kinase
LVQSNVELTDEILNKWQNIVDLMARIMNVPVALIMRVDYPQIEVFKASSNPKNPYEPGDQEHLAGLYCETVIKTQSKLLVPNALKDPEWKDNPDVELGMISYLGLPLNWPNGIPFGTICILDNKENSYNEEIKMLLKEFRDMAEMHLTLLFQNNQLQESREDYKRAFNQLEFLKDILVHDIKNIFQGLKLNISIFSEQMKDELFGNQKEILLHNLEEQIKKGTRLVSNVYTYSKVEEGKKELEKVDLINYLNKSVKSLDKNFPKTDIQLKKNIILETDTANILANKFLEDLFDNILANAVKHNESEIIKISVTASEIQHNNENYYRVEFCDNGVGIPDERKSTIMREKQYDTHDGTIRFGLSIIKKLTERFKGKLLIKNRIEDDYTQGTCFILLFPTLK